MYKFFLGLVCSASLSAQMVAGVAVVVKSQAITMLDIKKEMTSSKIDMKKATDKLVREKLEEAEIKERKISVASTEVYDDIKETAKRNNMSVNDLYEAALNANGLSSSQMKAKVKQKLLSQKLYSAISYSQISEPTDSELEDYYNTHKESYAHPASFTAVIYQSKEETPLREKIQNPMFHSPDVRANEQVLPYDRISPELARLLSKTPLNTFTAIIPDGQGGHMSFYVKEIEDAAQAGFEGMKHQLANTIRQEKREQVLSDYFARLRQNTDIKYIRMPE